MPWDHCEVEFILDDEDCPTCGVSKAEWTVQIDVTRAFVVGTAKITLCDIGAALNEVKRTEGLVNARRLAAELNYERLVVLCRKWATDHDGEPLNNPNDYIDANLMLLPYMKDELLPEDAREGLYKGDGAGPILEMCRAIEISGTPCKESTEFDEEVLAAYCDWRGWDPMPPKEQA